jgi:thiamine biosynthesis protein ThiS
MNLHINGEARTFPDPTPPVPAFTLAALIESLSMKSDRVAVELNRDIIPRDRWPETLLKDGDRLEIVHFVGGGCSTSRRNSQMRVVPWKSGA